MNQLTEAKELNRQAAEKIKEYELLEEARRRGYKHGVKINSTYGSCVQYPLLEPFYVNKNGCVIDYKGTCIFHSESGWAEIIPEEEKKEIETALKLSTNNMSKTTTHIHDQIREGGWLFIFNKSKMYDHIPTMRIFGDFPIPDEIIKVGSYNRLLALSKVLNEGKERGDNIYTVMTYQGQLRTNCEPSESVEFYEEFDCDFALEFAEKEWKIFYNAK